MGGGTYSSLSRSVRSESLGYDTKLVHEIFESRSINNAMNPFGIVTRESRDSEEHPESLAIIIGLDVTGSMGSVPHHLVKSGLPTMVDTILQRGINHPQILFMGIGDHDYDNAPLQVGQFESSDELLDKWLTSVYLEGGGGSNYGESYFLAWYFAARHTSTDCFEKRKQKGFLFTIGDEPVLKDIPKTVLKKIMGDGQYTDYSAMELLDMARETYHTYHIHIKETASGSREQVISSWRQIMSDNLLIVEKHQDVPSVIANKIIEIYGVKSESVSDSNTTIKPSEEVEVL